MRQHDEIGGPTGSETINACFEASLGTVKMHLSNRNGRSGRELPDRPIWKAHEL